MSDVMSLPRLDPFVGISRGASFKPEGAPCNVTVLLYGAFNAMGLIGSECNGIALIGVFDENENAILTDEICKESSGYYGPSKAQLSKFDEILGMDWKRIRDLVNHSKRARYFV